MGHCRVEQAAPHRVLRRALRLAVAVVGHRLTAVSVDGIEQWRRRRQRTVRRQHRQAS